MGYFSGKPPVLVWDSFDRCSFQVGSICPELSIVRSFGRDDKEAEGLFVGPFGNEEGLKFRLSQLWHLLVWFRFCPEMFERNRVQKRVLVVQRKICLGRGGHVDSGKSTTTGRLIFELGGLPERELEKLKAEADRLGHLAIQQCG